MSGAMLRNRCRNKSHEFLSETVTLLAKAEHPGFEGQVGYFLLAVVLQWLIYSAVVYSLLAVSCKKRSTAGAIKEISNQS
jgi:hypothetical protein